MSALLISSDVCFIIGFRRKLIIAYTHTHTHTHSGGYSCLLMHNSHHAQANTDKGACTAKVGAPAGPSSHHIQPAGMPTHTYCTKHLHDGAVLCRVTHTSIRGHTHRTGDG